MRQARGKWRPVIEYKLFGVSALALSILLAALFILPAPFWTRAEGFRKRPWRLVATFGARALFLFLTRRLTLEAAFDEVSHALEARVRPIVLPRAEAAVDVDKLEDLELVRRVLAQEAGHRPAESAAQSERSSSATKPPLAAS